MTLENLEDITVNYQGNLFFGNDFLGFGAIGHFQKL